MENLFFINKIFSFLRRRYLSSDPFDISVKLKYCQSEVLSR